MAITILVAVLSVGWVVTGILYVARTRGLREALDLAYSGQSEAQDLRILAEREATQAQTELMYIKNTFTLSLQQPRYVALTEENVQQLGALIAGITKNPNQMN